MSYSIGPVSRGVNNLCEDIFNGGKQYIQPAPTQPVQSVAQPIFRAPPPVSVQPLPPSQVYKIPSVTYTPEPLRSHFEPLNPRYNDSFYGKR